MTLREDWQNATEGPPPNPSTAPLHSAALAARLLESACAPGSTDPLQLEVVRWLARDLAEELGDLAVLADGGTDPARMAVIEGALRAADTANLAACSVPKLSGERVSRAAAATYLAAGATRALSALIDAGPQDTRSPQASYALRDARGATWRARLAARQVDESLKGAG